METSTPLPKPLDFSIHIDFPKWWFLGALIFTLLAAGLFWYRASRNRGWHGATPVWVPLAGGVSALVAIFCATKFVTHLTSALGSTRIGLGAVLVIGVVLYFMMQEGDRR